MNFITHPKITIETSSRPVKAVPSYYSIRSFRTTPGASLQGMEHDIKPAGELLDFLTANTSKMGEDDVTFQSEFEHLTAMCMLTIRDPELVRVLKECGWTGNRYITPSGGRWDVDFVIQALSNYYLKCTNMAVLSSVNHFSVQTSTGRHRSTFDNISPFCPELVIEALRLKGGEIRRPFKHPFVGACMLADISGFSAYSGQMCSKGVTGLDELRSVTNGLLGHFVRTVYEFGGDVIAFAGDALICVFHDNDSNSKGTEGTCCVRALACASLLCKDESHHLSTHVAVTYGEMSVALIGGLQDQWVYILTGKCINDLSDCIQAAGPKQVAATASCLEQLRGNTAAETLLVTSEIRNSTNVLISLNSYDTDYLKHVLDPTPRLSRKHLCETHLHDIIIGEEAVMSTLHTEDGGKKEEEQALASSMIKFVPKPVKHALRGDILDSIGELRQVTTLFLSLDSYRKDIHGADPLKLQDFFARAQKHLQASGGFLRQFLVDDKGCVLIAMWGVPSFTYANNCSRALYFAVALQKDLLSSDLQISVGISTGMVFCGCVGAEARKDYVGIGTDVNIAARLMSKAKGRIFTDATTYMNCNPPTKELLVEAEKLRLKGMSAPMTPYTYNSDDLPPLSEPDRLDSNYLLQKRVTQMIDTQLDNISNAEVELEEEVDLVDLPKSAVFLLGPAGSGKSVATNYFRTGAQRRGIKSILLQIQSFHKGVPYSVVRMLLLDLISAGEARDNSDAQRKLLMRLISSGFPHYSDQDIDHAYASLECILGRTWQPEGGSVSSGRRGSRLRTTSSDFDMKDEDVDTSTPSTPLASATVGASRVKTRKNGEVVLCKLLQLLLSHSGPYAIILENGHLCDELSWKIVNALFSERDLQLIILVTVLVKVNVAKKETQGTLYKRDKRRSLHEGSQMMDVDEILGNIGKGNASTDMMTERPSSSLDTHDSILRLSTTESELHMELPGEPTINRSRITRKLESELPSGCLALMTRRFSEILELGGLNHDEIKEILTASLQVDSVSESLIQMVIDVSSGNPFWCNTIASFIKDRGLKELEEARKKSDSDSNAILKMLVVCRLDHLSVDELIVLKHASIIGYDFSYKLLQSIVPHKVFKSLDKYTGNLVEQGFIRCFEEVPELKFCFSNDVFQSTLYSLTLPTDAALVHQAIAECIEVSHQDNLQPFYPMLAVHYKLSGPQFRDSAFKYELKSADQAIAQGAFTEGLDFARAAYMLAETKAEYSILLDVLVAGLEDLALARSPNPPQTPRESSWQQPLTPTTPVTPVTPSTPAGGRVGASKRYSISAGSGDKLTRDYQHLKNNVERAITQLQRKKEASLAAAAAAIKANAELTEEERKRMLLAHRTPSTQLNWQASYVTRRKDERRTQSGYGGWFGTYFRSSAIGERQSSGSSIGSASRPALQRNVSTSMEHPSPQCCVVS